MPPLTLSEQGILLAKQSYRMVLARRSPHGAFITRNFFSSPLYRLFARHAERPSVRHLLLRKSRRPFPSNYNPTPNLTSPASTGSAGPVSSSGVISGKSLSFSQRLRKLSREYGWSAFGVYMALSALDFPFCFLAVRWLGTERIGRWEHAIVEWFKRAIPLKLPEKWGGKVRNEKEAEVTEQESLAYDHGVKKAEQANSGESASIWTQLALAYAIHKSFIFVRVPLAAAVTPKVVKTLRGWGWNIGKLTPKAEREARKAQKVARQEVNQATKTAREAQKSAD